MLSTNWDEINERANELTGAALDEWNRVAPVLHKRELLTVLDVRSLQAYCNQHAHLVMMDEALRKAVQRESNAEIELVTRMIDEARKTIGVYCDNFLTPPDANGRMDLSENLTSFERARLEKRPLSKSKSEVDVSNQIVRSLVPWPSDVELDTAELEEWNRVAPSLHANGHLESDGRVTSLADYCQSVVQFASLESQLRIFVENGGDDAEVFQFCMKIMRDQIESSCELLRVDLVRVKLDANWRIIVE